MPTAASKANRISKFAERAFQAGWTASVGLLSVAPDLVLNSMNMVVARPFVGRADSALDPRLQAVHRFVMAADALESKFAEHKGVTQTVEQVRVAAELIGRPLWGKQIPVADCRELLIEGAEDPLPALHYSPHQQNAPAILLFHGGGFVVGGPEGIDRAARALCNAAQAHVISVGYRLAPEHPFPAAPSDAFAAWRWLVNNAASIGADGYKLAVAGESAGATLATLAAWWAAENELRVPDAQLLFYPALDLSESDSYPSRERNANVFPLSESQLRWVRDLYLAGKVSVTDEDAEGVQQTAKLALASPIRIPDLSKMPPTIISTGHFDMLHDESEAYGRRLLDAGVAVTMQRHPALSHGYTGMMGLSKVARDAVLDAGVALSGLLQQPLAQLERPAGS